MRYTPCWKQIGISQDRYTELLHFCRQYPEWKAEANSLIGIRAIKMDGQPHGTADGMRLSFRMFASVDHTHRWTGR